MTFNFLSFFHMATKLHIFWIIPFGEENRNFIVNTITTTTCSYASIKCNYSGILSFQRL